MKIIILALLTVIICGSVNAQIIVTSADMPVANQSFTLSTPAITTITSTSGGAGQTWDFSGLTPVAQIQDTFFGKSSMPSEYRIFLSSASIGEKAPDISLGTYTLTNSYNIYKSLDTAFEQTAGVGELNGIPISATYTPVDVIYQLPLHFNDSSASNSAFDVNIPLVGSVIQQQTRKNIVDGWGTLLLPMGSFDVLRVTSIVTDYDSAYSDALGFGISNYKTTYKYKFIGQKRGLPLLEIDSVNALGQLPLTTITYQDTLAVSGIPTHNQPVLFTFSPNPSTDMVKVFTDNSREIKIADITGRTISIYQVNNAETDIDVSLFINGIYFISASDNNGKTITEKLVVQH